MRLVVWMLGVIVREYNTPLAPITLGFIIFLDRCIFDFKKGMCSALTSIDTFSNCYFSKLYIINRTFFLPEFSDIQI